MKKRLYVIFWLCLYPAAIFAQVDSTASDSLPLQMPPDTLAAAQADTLQSDSAEVLFKIRPWKYHAPLHSQLAATDSTLRWQVWPSWSYKKNRDPGIVSFRLGTAGRTNALQIDAHEPRHQQLYWQDVQMNDPVSGGVNWNYIPHHKIQKLYETDLGTVHRTTFHLNEYHLNKPLSQLNYTESSNDTRNLEFVVSANLSQKTNAEISYWDRRDGGEFSNSGIIGRQIYARVSHQLDQRQAVKFKFLNNNYDNQLPFGYNIINYDTYNFDPFQTTPNESSGEAKRASTIIGLNYYRRPADTTETTSNLHAGIYTNGISREVTYSAAEPSYNIREIGATARKWQQFGPLRFEGGASYRYFINKSDSGAFEADNWGELNTEARAVLQPANLIEIEGSGGFRSRSDGYSDYRLGAGITLSTGGFWELSADVTSGNRMPTPQQLYWRGVGFEGDEDLENESIFTLHSELRTRLSRRVSAGLKAQLKQVDDGILINDDSTFTNSNPYSSLSGSAYFEYESSLFEFSGSATFQQFGSYLGEQSEPLPVDEEARIWFRGSAYVKGYLFDRATYVKAGVAGMITPQPYSPAQYYPSLDFWQPTGNQAIPSFNRLDVDLSARIRSIMVLLRYENVLDDVVQPGYFETAGYPMSSRRFIFGIRVQFRN